MTRRAFLLGLAGASVCSLVLLALILGARHHEEGLANGSAFALSLQAATGLALLAASVAIVFTRPHWVAAAFFALAALVLEAQALPLPYTGGAGPFTLALAVGAVAAPLAGAGVLAYAGRVHRSARLAAGVAIGTCLLWAGVVPATLFDARREGCFACPRNLLLAHGDRSLHADVLRSGLYASAVVCAALAAVLLARWLALGWRGSAIVAPLHSGAATAAGASAAVFWAEARTPTFSIGGTSRVGWLVECAGLAVVAAAALGEVARGRIASVRLARSALAAIPTPEGLRIALAASAGDEALSVVFPRTGQEAVTGEGRAAPEAGAELRVTDVLREGMVVAQLRHRELPWHASQRLAESVRALGLALEHASSRARLRAQLADLTESRARLVEVADGERRRLERNLHDGAQQRLIALSVTLGRSQNGHAETTEARREVLAALGELRELAHGIHPASLTDSGIDAALRELADGSRVPIRLEVAATGRLPVPVETAVYRVAADGVRAAERLGDGGVVTVTLHVDLPVVSVRLRLPGVENDAARGALVHAFDRVAALGGRSGTVQRGDDTLVEVELTCAS